MSLKIITIALFLLVSTLSLEPVHHADINIDNLTDDQRSARDYITGQVNKLSGATLIAGQQNGDTFTLRFLGAELPKTLTDVTVVKSSNGLNIVKAVTSSTVGGLQDNGRVTTKKVFTRADGTFSDALRASGF